MRNICSYSEKFATRLFISWTKICHYDEVIEVDGSKRSHYAVKAKPCRLPNDLIIGTTRVQQLPLLSTALSKSTSDALQLANLSCFPIRRFDDRKNSSIVFLNV